MVKKKKKEPSYKCTILSERRNRADMYVQNEEHRGKSSQDDAKMKKFPALQLKGGINIIRI